MITLLSREGRRKRDERSGNGDDACIAAIAITVEAHAGAYSPHDGTRDLSAARCACSGEDDTAIVVGRGGDDVLHRHDVIL